MFFSPLRRARRKGNTNKTIKNQILLFIKNYSAVNHFVK